MTKPLIPKYELVDHHDLTDLLMVVAKNVENSLIQSGAEPGKDYNVLDLYKLAQPFALELFKQDENSTFTIT